MSKQDIKQLDKIFTDSVFIYASGKSSSEFPLQDYRDRKYIVVNGAVRVFIESGITPFAYVFDDGGFLKDNIDLVVEAIRFSKFIFIPEVLYIEYALKDKISLEDQDKIYFIDKVNRRNGFILGSYRLFFIKNIFNKKLKFKFSRIFLSSKNIGFSKDVTQGYFCARTIPYVALQLAYYLGFKKVFLVGLDLNASVGRFYDGSNPLPTTLDKDYPKHIYPSFELAAKRVINEEFMVYNLSMMSRLPESIIPKITLNQLASLIDDE